MKVFENKKMSSNRKNKSIVQIIRDRNGGWNITIYASLIFTCLSHNFIHQRSINNRFLELADLKTRQKERKNFFGAKKFKNFKKI